MPKVIFQDLGFIDYKEAWDYQEKRFNEILDVKKNNRKENRQDPTLSYLLFCEHPHVYTLGKSGDENNLLEGRLFIKLIEEGTSPPRTGTVSWLSHFRFR